MTYWWYKWKLFLNMYQLIWKVWGTQINQFIGRYSKQVILETVCRPQKLQWSHYTEAHRAETENYHVQTLHRSSRTDWDQLALQKFVLFCVYVSHTLSCWATSKQGVHRLWRHVQKMLPLLPKQPGKTQQGDSLCTKALSEELMLSGKTPVTLRNRSADLLLLFLISISSWWRNRVIPLSMRRGP